MAQKSCRKEDTPLTFRQDQLVTVKQEGERKPIKRERPLSATSASHRPTKVSRTADGKLIYHLDSDDDDEKPATSTENAVIKDKAGVGVVDLLD
jgi:YD repeat-containing protein